MAAPTLVSYTDNIDTSQTASGTAYPLSVTVQVGDVLAAFAAGEGGGVTFSAPTGTGLTFAQQQKPNSANSGTFTQAYAWTATATTAGTFNVSTTKTSAGGTASGAGVYVWRNSTGAGASASNQNAGSAPSLTLTTTGDNSAILYWAPDWSAADGTTRTWRAINGTTPTTGNGFETRYFRNASYWSVFGAYWPDAGTAGAKTTGMTAPTGQQPAAIAVEILGTVSAAAPVPARPMVMPMGAAHAGSW